ncbi:hypothetical protein EHI42_19720 [Rhizobium hidalgonense]|uniref:hypothetical protein n=1 Tax=Rhizobium hidalgonense TaxID=1538159 RepID=UPI000FEC425C|nr:hypothetical protein [Rhizobium hidalgonense]RWX13625.1 hypothetical protein EHI42_19720 [Rhizobium hidalgonense]
MQLDVGQPARANDSFDVISCIIENWTFDPGLCPLLERAYTATATFEVSIDVHGRGTAVFGCDLYSELSHRRTGLAPVSGEWRPEVAAEYGGYYWSAFSQVAQRRLAIADVLITPKECVEGQRTTYVFISQQELTIIEDRDSCEPIKILSLLRLSDICSGTFNVIDLLGIAHLAELHAYPNKLVRMSTSRMSLPSDVRDDFFAQVELYRNRSTDITLDQK